MQGTAVRKALSAGRVQPLGPKVCVQSAHWYAFHGSYAAEAAHHARSRPCIQRLLLQQARLAPHLAILGTPSTADFPGISARCLALPPLIEFRTPSGTLPVVVERTLSDPAQVQ